MFFSVYKFLLVQYIKNYFSKLKGIKYYFQARAHSQHGCVLVDIGRTEESGFYNMT